MRVGINTKCNFGKCTHVEDPVFITGLSIYHLTSEFKSSVGVTPYHYLMQQRVAQAVGFSDQIHSTRCFIHLTGMTQYTHRL
jgi:AraC-like DNA-binding protein